MYIDISNRIRDRINYKKQQPFIGTLSEAYTITHEIESYYMKLRNRQKYIRKVDTIKIPDTGNHTPSNIVNAYVSEYPIASRYKLKLRWLNICSGIIKNTNTIPSPILLNFLKSNFNRFQIAGKYQSLIWDYIYSHSNLLDNEFYTRYGVSKEKAKVGMKNGKFVSKQLSYEYFTTNQHISYTERYKLLLDTIKSNQYTKTELNDMLMHRNNYLCLLTIMSENYLLRNKQNNLKLLKDILTKDNYKIALTKIQNMPYFIKN